MALGKLLKLGGMENSLPKTDQSLGRFRVARNVLPTPDGDIIPRSECAEIAGQSNNFRYIHYYTQYDDDILSIVSEDHDTSGTYTYHLYKDNTRIPNQHFSLGTSYLEFFDSDQSYSAMSFRKNNTTFFYNPNQFGGIFKYDGVEVSYAGCQQPIISSADYASGGTKFIRVIQHCIDFDNNEPVSEYVQFPTNAATTMTIRVDGGATNIIGSTNVFPSDIIPARPDTYPAYFFGTATYNAGNQDYSITTTDTNILNPAQVGSYVIVEQGFTPAVTTGLTEPCLGYALKIKSISPLRLDALDAKYLSLQREWKTATIGTAAVAASIAWGSRTFVSFWASSSANGNYVFKGLEPSFPESSTSRTWTIDVTSTTVPAANAQLYVFTMSNNLGDWYDVNIRKLSPNAVYPFNNGQHNFLGLSQYQDQIILWAEDLVWFSDTTVGGSFEQLNTSSFIRVGDTEFGKVMSVCGTQDFLLVSRERKNYFVNGTLPTGNFRVQEITEAEIGSWTNNGTINVKDSVVMITAIGVFQVLGGGRVAKLSSKIPKNFSRYNSAGINEDIAFSLIGTNILQNLSSDLGLSVAYDEYRELLAFMQKGPNYPTNPILVLHTATGEFYEWTGLVSDAAKRATAIGFIDGQFLVGSYTETTGTLGAKTLREDSSLVLTYPATYPCQLFSTWMTAGEPSLEKEVCQLKIFGNITPNGTTSSIKVVHFKDWDYSTRITDEVFFPISSSTYSNKKRLNADKALAVSCGIELAATSCYFRLESMEIEFNPIQQGMKR